MIRMLILANNSLLADSLVSMLAGEPDMDVVRLTHREFVKGDPYSVVIIIDEGESENETIKVADLFWNHDTLLVIIISLKSRNISVYESYQLINPEMERVIHIVREFSGMNLKKKDDEVVNISALRKMIMVTLFQTYADPLTRNI